MKDCFGSEISVGDTVVYATRHGSSQFMNVARIDETFDNKVKATVLAGTDYDWRCGRSTWNESTKSYDSLPLESRSVTLRASGNVIVTNGIDALAIHDKVMTKQREHMKAQETKR